MSFNKSGANNQFFTFFNLNPVATLILSVADAKILYANKAYIQLSGFKNEELIGKTPFELNIVSDLERTRVREYLKDANKQIKGVEVQLLSKSGKEVNVCMSAEIIEFNSEKFFIATFLVLTNSKEDELQLNRLANIVHFSSDAIISKGLDGIIISWNESAEKILGYKRDEIIGKHISITFPEELLHEESALLLKILNNQPVQQYETERVKKDGKRITVSITLSPIKNNQGQIVGVSKILRDITASKQAEIQLIDIKNRLAMATQNSEIGVWDFNVLNNTFAWDDNMLKIYGLQRENFKSTYQSWLSYLHPEDKAKIELETSFALSGKKEFDTEFRIVWPDESVHFIKGRAKVQRDKDGKPFRMLGTNWDITQEKLNAEKIKNYSILEAKSKEMEQFAYITSHDLREPLLSIKNFATALNNDYKEKLDDEGRYFINAITRASTRMEILINGLLDYSRLGQVKELMPVNCNLIMEETMADFHSLILASQAKVIWNNLPEINAYPLELKQVFQNLLSNAIKFSKPNVTPIIEITAHPVEHGWRFEILDNGIGIEDKNKEKIFIIFQRLHNRNEFEGNGIGLAHCQKIVELHNGRIWVESVPNQFSKFCFTILTNQS